MSKPARSPDLLLLAGKVITVLVQAAMGFGAAVLVLVAGALAFSHESVQAEIAAETGRADLVLPLLPMFGVLLVGFAIVAALFVFFGKLRAIINTVGEGDPFLPANAERLSLMAWLMLGVQLLVWATIPFALQLTDFVKTYGDDVHMDVNTGIDLSGFLLVIILFILARVFRHGTAMRDDLEGTV